MILLVQFYFLRRRVLTELTVQSNLVKDRLLKMRTYRSTKSCLHEHTGRNIVNANFRRSRTPYYNSACFRAHADVTLRWEQLRNSRSKFALRAVAIMNQDHRAVSHCNNAYMLPFGEHCAR